MPGIMTSSDEDENQPPCKPAEVVGAEKNDDGGEVWLHWFQLGWRSQGQTRKGGPNLTASYKTSPTPTMQWRAGISEFSWITIVCLCMSWFGMKISCSLQWRPFWAGYEWWLVEVSHLASSNIITHFALCTWLNNCLISTQQEEEARQKAAWWENMTLEEASGKDPNWFRSW